MALDDSLAQSFGRGSLRSLLDAVPDAVRLTDSGGGGGDAGEDGPVLLGVREATRHELQVRRRPAALLWAEKPLLARSHCWREAIAGEKPLLARNHRWRETIAGEKRQRAEKPLLLGLAA